MVKKALTAEEWEKKVRELELDHLAAGSHITCREAEEIIAQVYGPKPCKEREAETGK
ncbi:MAG: hypothetical protein HPY90_12365 [Syntrophothermus sp.]|uniref:hypothetical protein n=1 Tax=Syntrophothermus sp. TaxID=2736299 RepID=UPI00257CC400|nr:hypothetical protein [Syntrophothermus sp.]NSW84044.1 hypothetical protein [Syntrophothermus sp.]